MLFHIKCSGICLLDDQRDWESIQSIPLRNLDSSLLPKDYPVGWRVCGGGWACRHNTSLLKIDLSSIRTDQRPFPGVFSARGHDLQVRARLGPSETMAANGQEWTLKIDLSITICNSRQVNRRFWHLQLSSRLGRCSYISLSLPQPLNCSCVDPSILRKAVTASWHRLHNHRHPYHSFPGARKGGKGTQ